MGSPDLLLLSADEQVRQAVQDGLSSNGTIYTLGADCRTLVELSTRMEQAAASVAVVDLEAVGELGTLVPLINRFSQTRFVVLVKEQSPDLLMHAMQIGVRFVMQRNAVHDELTTVLKRFKEVEKAVAVQRGRLITVLSAGGGCGATTIAVNLADELRQLHAGPAMLVDLDVHYGAAGAYLGVEGEYGIADVLSRSQVDEQLLHSTAQTYEKHFDVLLSPVATRPLDPPVLNTDHLPGALDACRLGYACTVVDAPRLPMDVVETLVNASHATLLVLQLSVKDVRCAAMMLKAMRHRNLPMDRVMPVVNRFRGRHQWLSFAEAQEALNGVALEWVRNDYRNASRGVNFGTLLGISAPRSVLRKDLRRLALKLAPPSTT